jgi:hypothetical protein
MSFLHRPHQVAQSVRTVLSLRAGSPPVMIHFSTLNSGAGLPHGHCQQLLLGCVRVAAALDAVSGSIVGGGLVRGGVVRSPAAG